MARQSRVPREIHLMLLATWNKNASCFHLIAIVIFIMAMYAFCRGPASEAVLISLVDGKAVSFRDTYGMVRAAVE